MTAEGSKTSPDSENRPEGSGEAEDASGGTSLAYSAVMITVVVVGGLAVVVGAAGVFISLTGGLDGGEEFEVLGAYECEEPLANDPQVVHETEYAIERQVLSPSEVETFNGSVEDGTVEITVETAGPLLAASATEPDGRPIDIETVQQQDSITVERATTAPFRLWIDAVGEEGTVTRMQLDICPPADA